MQHKDFDKLDDQFKHLYTKHYVPWCAEHEILEVSPYTEFRKNMIDKAFELVMQTHIGSLDLSTQEPELKPMEFEFNVAATKGMQFVKGMPPMELLSKALFVADRVDARGTFTSMIIGGPHNHKHSTIRQCAQCHQDVWISKEVKDEADKADAIICTECLPEMAGMSPEEFKRKLKNGIENNEE